MRTRGGFYAVALISLLSLSGFVSHAGAQTYTYKVLYNFCAKGGTCPDGSDPVAGLARDTAGNLYGTTVAGGANDDGAVFKVDTTGHETVLYSFCSQSNCTDGLHPKAGLILDSMGNLYGTTFQGGANGLGTVYKVDLGGKETVIYSFCSVSGCADGDGPLASLILDSSGSSLYGTTPAGGSHNGGTVFKISTAGVESVLYNFCSEGTGVCTDGQSPEASLLSDGAGNLYGTTEIGGANKQGTVFKVDESGHETVLYTFCPVAGCADGAMPTAGLIQDASGNLYGTAFAGGVCIGKGSGCGTVFKIDNQGHETVLYTFCSASGCKDGGLPSATLVQDLAGNFYGTAFEGGSVNAGTVFKLDTANREAVLHTFGKKFDGGFPQAGLIRDGAGNLYGTTTSGGTGNHGTVYELAMKAGTATVTLSSSMNPSFVEESVTFSVTVSGSGAIPTGMVTFEQGTTMLGTVSLSNGTASLPETFTKTGTDSIVASYLGDENYDAAKSKPLKQVVKQYTTTTTLASALNPSTYGQPITFTATVSSAGPVPTGTVTFKSGSTSLGTASLSGGVAKITTSTLAAGTATITASYGGDTANAKSTSTGLKQVVDQASSTTTIVSSVNPSKVGQKVKFTATVTSPTTKPTGIVTFMDGSQTLGTGAVAEGSGMASYTTSTLAAGSHKITAVYAGSANVTGSTSSVLTQTVN
jgi:uncharacterized repeat protein (TIGR03803 family)